MRVLIVAAIASLLGCAAAAAQPHASHATPALTMDVLQRPIALRAGIGAAHDAVASLPPQAQAYYDQGLALLHNYIWIDAARSFAEVLRLAPGTVMGAIGLSYAYEGLNMRTVARQTMAQVRGVSDDPHAAAHLRVRERDLAAQEPGAPRATFDAYQAALDEAIAQFPDDIEFLLMRGVAASGVPGDRGQGGKAESTKYYEEALRKSSTAFAAHHYLTHAYENAGNATQALEAAQRYERLADAVPHAHHMLGHDLRRVGRIKDAIAQFEVADRLERQYFETEKIVPETDWHYEHNLDLLGTSYLYAGQVRKASALMQAAFDLPTANLVQAVNKRQWPLMLRLLGRSDEALKAAAGTGCLSASGGEGRRPHRDRTRVDGAAGSREGCGGGQRGDGGAAYRDSGRRARGRADAHPPGGVPAAPGTARQGTADPRRRHPQRAGAARA